MRFSSSIIAAATLTSGAFAKTIPVEVGSGGLTFSPNTTTAEVGDVLEFSFFPREHNVAQGSFDTPCGTGAIKEPIFSGNIPVSSGKSQTSFSVKVNDTMPMWLYCSVQMHCQLGMVMVVNPPSSDSMSLMMYKSAAAKVGSSVTPFTSARGGVISEGTSNSNGAAANATSPASKTTTGSGSRATSTKSSASENLPLAWGMWGALAGVAGFGAIAL